MAQRVRALRNRPGSNFLELRYQLVFELLHLLAHAVLHNRGEVGRKWVRPHPLFCQLHRPLLFLDQVAQRVLASGR